jgi:lycopene beta-cyclase
VEDTFFSRSPSLEEPARVEAVLSYARRFGVVEEVLRQERGVLPMPWSTLEQPAPERSPLSAGYRGGFFHPATGYSLPIALRLACHVARQFPNVFGEPMRALHRAHRSQARYAQRLNALLFHAFPPAAMWNVFARFYRLPEALIARFYALRMTRLDRVRILVGRPPSGFSIGYAFSGGGSKPPSKQRSSKGGRPTRPVGAL